MNIHPSVKEIQQFAIDQSGCSSAAIVHIESCMECKKGSIQLPAALLGD